MTPEDIDGAVRLAAFRFLEEQTQVVGEVLPWSILSRGFDFRGRRVPLVSQQGIFKPAALPEMPLTIRTTPVVEGRERPYEDEVGTDGLIAYCWRGNDPEHPENAGLRTAMRRRAPLAYLYGIEKGHYLAVWPVYIVGERRNPRRPAFSVAVDDQQFALIDSAAMDAGRDDSTEARRAYVTVATRRRLHQQSFRHRVLRAYRERCAVCRLRHRELLDAAHIVPDKDERGWPVVRNGLSLCKLHHAAFDGDILGVRPDLSIHIRTDVLEEKDGPMLVHGIQGFQNKTIVIPRKPELKPDPSLLDERYARFLAA